MKLADANDKDSEAETIFRRDMEDSAHAENSRREGLIKARAGVFFFTPYRSEGCHFSNSEPASVFTIEESTK
jgi:hypothetical protein